MFPLIDDNPTDTRPYITIFLILASCIIYVFQYFILPEQELRSFILNWGATPRALFSGNAELTEGPYPFITLFTSMFMHGSFLHLLGNIMFLWIYGNNIEDSMGHLRFFIFYIIVGISACIIHSLYTKSSGIPMIGASGAISGILGAYLLLYPRAKVSTLVFLGFFITVLRLPAGFLIIIWFFIQLFNVYFFDSNVSNVAWFAHIGGFCSGILLLHFFKKKHISYFSHGKEGKNKRVIRIKFRK